MNVVALLLMAPLTFIIMWCWWRFPDKWEMLGDLLFTAAFLALVAAFLIGVTMIGEGL